MGKRLVLVMGFVLMLIYNLYAQQLTGLEFMGDVLFSLKDTRKNGIEGSSYLFQTWDKGLVKIKGADVLTIDSLNFDTYANSLIFLYKGQIYNVLNNGKIEYFILNGDKFLNLKTDKGESFFEILTTGDRINLLKLYKCEVIVGKSSNGILPEIKDKFSIITEYYTIKKNDNIQRYKNSKKSLYNLLFDKNGEIRKYIKENNLKIKRQNDLIKIFDYYNML